MKWEWKGRKLAPPHEIVRRLLVWPLFQLARCVLFALALAGWGMWEAKQVWRDTE